MPFADKPPGPKKRGRFSDELERTAKRGRWKKVPEVEQAFLRAVGRSEIKTREGDHFL